MLGESGPNDQTALRKELPVKCGLQCAKPKLYRDHHIRSLVNQKRESVIGNMTPNSVSKSLLVLPIGLVTPALLYGNGQVSPIRLPIPVRFHRRAHKDPQAVQMIPKTLKNRQEARRNNSREKINLEILVHAWA